ncbi:MAG TPA: tyrosine-type recombinase/integrase [Dehalococcoidia bacterium]|nr:tyrosine-type recombinase/integrase [Dehalococcoidia bacterium]
MTNRSAAIRHVRYTRRSREQHATADEKPPRAYPERVQTPILPQATGQGSLPLAGFDRLYEAQLRAERKSAKTIRIYYDALGNFARWFEASYGRPATLADVNVVETRLFLGDALGRQKYVGHPTLEGTTQETLSVSTVHQYTRGLKTFGGWLEREGYTAVHPLHTLRLPRLEERQLRPLSEEEERALLGAYDDNNPTECRLKAIFLLMLDTGIRCGELMSLSLANLDLDGGFLLVMGKGRKERSIPFGFTTERLLRKYVTFFRPEPALPSIGELFLSPEGYPLTYDAVKMLFTRAAKRSGVERLHPHLLRHTFGIRAQENGMPTITLQHYMGHTSSKVTERYAHAAQSEKLKRARGYSPIDQLGLRVKRVGPAPNGKRAT